MSLVDNISVFLRGCEELGLKGSQLFDPGALIDTPARPTAKVTDCYRKLKNVLITIYWLGRAANGCASYSGPTLDVKQFEGLLAQMRKELEQVESPQHSVRDSGYIDCWDSERSDSLSPPRHGREDSFDSLDSFGSRSRQTPSPDVLVTRGSSDGRGSDSESDGAPYRKLPDVRKDDMLARRTSVSEPRAAVPFNQYLPNRSNQSGYVPAAALRRKKDDADEGGGRKSWSTATSPIGGDRPFRFSRSSSVSNEPQSVSMIDMRGEEEGPLPPHSQERHGLIQEQYTRIKEEDGHWQDDLARWKSRRRSVSQDLIKKEEERKMMERLLCGDTSAPQRRKSIKTYREILEEKERREEDLRQAYRGARTQEEASAVLQRYAQRFSISEAVLERLQLPRLLDRSDGASGPCSPGSPFSPSLSPFSPSLSLSPGGGEGDPFDDDPTAGPLRFLRQPPPPAPRFTSMVEARVQQFPRALEASSLPPSSSGSEQQQPRPAFPQSRSSEPPDPPIPSSSSSRPMTSPRTMPPLLPKPYALCKEDVSLRLNGTAGDEQGRDSPRLFQPSPPTTAHDDTPDAVQAPCGGAPCPGGRPTSLPTALQTQGEQPAPGREREEATHTAAERAPPPEPSETPQRQTDRSQQSNSCAITVQSEGRTQQGQEMTSPVSRGSQGGSQSRASVSHSTVLGPASYSSPCQTALENSIRSPLATSNPNPKLRWEFFASAEEKKKDSSVNPQARQGDRWSWDPDEERKRQERWQQEQERLLQEKYRREQEKLKEEWERAQREVAEEERRYHQEERRILEETATPLTRPSPSRVGGAAPADCERRQHLLDGQESGSAESVEWRLRENDRTSDISTADDSQSSSLTGNQRSPALQNGQSGQKVPGGPSETGGQQETLLDSSRPSRAAGDRRFTGSMDLRTSPWSLSPPRTLPDTPSTPHRSVSGKKLCSSCGQPLGKGAAMIIETLSLCFHIQCFKCGVCRGQLGDTTTGTDVRIRNGLLNCHQCYIRSRSAGQPTTL